MDKQLTIVEFTPNSIKLLSGYYMKDKVKVLQCLEGEKLPLSENGLPKANDLRESLLTLMAKAREQSKVELGPLVVLYPPYKFANMEVRESNVTGNAENCITYADFRSCSIRATKVTPPVETEAVNFVPFRYSIDGIPDMTEFPLNKTSTSLEIDGDVHFMNRNVLSFYKDVIQSTGLKSSIYLQMVSTYASSYFVSANDKDYNFLLLEMQSDYTYITYVRNNHVMASYVVKEGISQVTARYAKLLNMTDERAKELISTFGFLKNLQFEYQTDEGYDLLHLSNTLLKAFLPTFDKIQAAINEYDIDIQIPIVLTGIANGIFGMESGLAFYFKRSVRVFKGRAMGAECGVYDAALGAIGIANKNYQAPRDQFQRSESDSQLKSTMFDR